MSKVQTVLDSKIIDLLKEETIVQLITINRETKKPELTVVSWVLATDDGKQIKIAVGHKGSSINNIEADPSVTLGLIGPESCYSVTGQASVSDIFSGTMKYRVITVDVEEVEDVMFYGGKLTTLPKYEKTYDPALAKKLDDEVYELLSSKE
ncbi:pyridoxamine 5'-phosphate oxidase [Niallia oryzisoli]|uniref:pyridoxamine 5'-phosphate oxidase n=1 Tax=Niallia oryzisoli TaxID=1737571 RepID=UPI003734F0E2